MGEEARQPIQFFRILSLGLLWLSLDIPFGFAGEKNDYLIFESIAL